MNECDYTTTKNNNVIKNVFNSEPNTSGTALIPSSSQISLFLDWKT